jgi:hypothetical protein
VLYAKRLFNLYIRIFVCHRQFLFWLYIILLIFWISKVFGLTIIQATWFIEMRIWCIQIGIIQVFALSNIYRECNYVTSKYILYICVWYECQLNDLVSWLRLNIRKKYNYFRLSIGLDLQPFTGNSDVQKWWFL